MTEVQGKAFKPYAVAMFDACNAVHEATEPSVPYFERVVGASAMVAAAILADQSEAHLADFEAMFRKMVADMRAGHARNGL